MNTAAANFLLSLGRLGVERIRFRILGRGRSLRHTALVTEPACASDSWPVSVTELFGAYSIAPLQGTYELNVANGSLAFTPPVAAAMSAQRSGYAILKKRRRKVKVANRIQRPTLASVPHELAA